MIPFKIELFDYEYNLTDYSMIDSPQIKFDYLTLETFQLDVPKILSVERGNYIIITQGKDNVFTGIVTALSFSKGVTNLTLRPLLSIFDVMCNFNREELKIKSLESFLKNIMLDLYAMSEEEQRIKGFEVEIKSETNNAKLGLVDNIHNLWEICILAFKKCGTIVKSRIDITTKRLIVTIDQVVETIKTIEADLGNIIDVELTLRDDYGTVNKVTVINRKNENERLTFHSEDFKRPVNFTYEFVDVEKKEVTETDEAEDFSTIAEKRARELFTPKKFQNLIEFSTSIDNSLIDCDIGSNVNIIYKNMQYNSVLTGFEISGQVKKYIFGTVRLDLTKILILENRGK